ncbi:tyrosine-type recombinase/integrase [Litorilituus sediminis]|uniref:Site-specific integrase n=1 Tax=Litorilituus sediminis TaxID=718192 RepID=A0A4P6P3P1_9GAMM|nr:tyrosine-type recombinase/integrase [Litorilituus sediminis]QBG34609.1 site-specific integrase [Litorilituus sediminis]
MIINKPTPLYPRYSDLIEFYFEDYPELTKFLNSLPDWCLEHFHWAKSFLEYTGRNKSVHTYDRFRNEIERFLLWAFLIKQSPIDQFRKQDILDYADFCWQPPVNWIGTSNQERFKVANGYSSANEAWFPFKIQVPKAHKSIAKIDKKKYRPSQETLKALFTAISTFYDYLMYEELCYGNPVKIARKDCRYFITDTQVKEIKRLTSSQWEYVLDTAVEMANEDLIFERNLFIIAALKTLFLRISELSERADWSPIMGHFWQDEDENWWLKVFGKGRKLRDITVPTDFLPFLQRYRLYRGLPGMPLTKENNVLVEKIRGQGGMTSRQLRRLVQDVFDKAYENMRVNEGPTKALKLKEASTHWLRHTGASMEIERGRPLKDVSEDLGHASMATTDTVYVQSENKQRAESGKQRKVN